MDEVIISGKTYISSKRAAEMCGYARDYVGQLARGGLIQAERISGLWYVLLESIQAYKEKATSHMPVPPPYRPEPNTESVVTLEGRDYVSALRAAKLTGYNPDYIGQLARGGKISSRQIGNRWYVDREALFAHKQEKDALLAAVQAESVGIKRPQPKNHPAIKDAREELLLYSRDDMDLMPALSNMSKEYAHSSVSELPPSEISTIPIRVIDHSRSRGENKKYYTMSRSRDVVSIPGKTIFGGKFAAAALTIVIVLAVGLISFQTNLIYATLKTPSAVNTASASASNIAEKIGDVLERFLTREIIYQRSE